MERILACTLSESGVPDRTDRELLGAARRLAEQTGAQLSVGVLTGRSGESGSLEWIRHGADRVYLAQDPLLSEAQADLAVAALQQLCRQVEPDLILFIGRTTSEEAAPRLAHRLGTGCLLDCVELAIEGDGFLVLSKPVYGGKVVARYRVSRNPAVVVVRSRTFDPAQPDESRRGEAIPVSLTLDASLSRTRRVERLAEEGEGTNLEEAEIIVSGGRGMGGPENFDCLDTLARLLKGAVGASRAACDLGWVPASWQIGQTGKKVAPKLYLAVGISGASQHLVGIAGAKHVAAINSDPKAPIFKVAELGVVDDYQNVIPHLIELLKQRLAG